MIGKNLLLHTLLLTLLASVACAPQSASPTPAAAIPNPASVYCAEHNGRLDLRTSDGGGVAGVCVFPDGSECDEWQFFHGACQPGDSLVRRATATPPRAAPSTDGWQTWRNEELGLSFQYPPDAWLVRNDDPLAGLSVVGPLVDQDHWPMFSVNYPQGREEYRPPEGADLAQWLSDHYLMAEPRQPDVRIAGTTAIHLRHARSPQSYAFDIYYFAQAGQLYSVVILHTGDREDWALYQKFLDSFRFDR